jgi:DNA-binding transcriptional regulator GbsR (MarR family)
MPVDLIEQDISKRKQMLTSLNASLTYLKQDEQKNSRAIDLLSQELFFLEDQLERYQTVYRLLKEEDERINADALPQAV